MVQTPREQCDSTIYHSMQVRGPLNQRAAWPKAQTPNPKLETLNPKPGPQEQCYGDRKRAAGTRNQRGAWPDGKFGDYAFSV